MLGIKKRVSTEHSYNTKPTEGALQKSIKRLMLQNDDLKKESKQIRLTLAQDQEQHCRLTKEIAAKEEYAEKLSTTITKRQEVLDEMGERMKIRCSPASQPQKRMQVSSRKHKSSLNVSKSVLSDRRQQTFSSAINIHGGGEDSEDKKRDAAKFGLWNTLRSKCNRTEMATFLESVPHRNDQASNQTVNNHDKRFQHSLNTMYCGGLLSQDKYQGLRNSERLIKHPDHVSLLPYKSLMSEINRKHVSSLRAFELSDIDGSWRTLDNLLLVLAKHYLGGDEDIDWFGNDGVFVVLFGGDGAPFGQNSTGTSFLISFLNLKERILSPHHNFLLIGGNVEEDSEDFLKYIRVLAKEMEKIEKKTYTICEKKISFRFEFPVNDQKFLAKILGELSNSATYPSSYANVTKGNMATWDGRIGEPGDESATWQKWNFDQKLQDAKAVSMFKKKNAKCSRAKVTKFIASRQSRTEFQPPLGRFSMNSKAEPLHLLNLGWQHWHNNLWTIVMEKDAAESYLKLLKEIGAGKLHYRLHRWWRDKSNTTHPSIRIIGEESKCLGHNFMCLVSSLMTGNEKKDLQLYVLAYAALKLRDAASVFVRVNISESDLVFLETTCKLLFAVYHLFNRVNLTIWTLSFVIPLHTREMFYKYGLGLGILSMQGREAKHKKLINYIHHTTTTTKCSKWKRVFQHEFADLLLTPEPSKKKRKTPESEKIIPDRFLQNDGYCYCGMQTVGCEKCHICSSHLLSLIGQACEAQCPHLVSSYLK